MITETKSTDLSRYVVTADDPDNLVKSPSFLVGRFGKDVYQAYEQEKHSTYKGNSNLELQLDGDNVIGSNFFDTILINQLIRNGSVQGNPRTALPSDLSNPEVLEMVRGEYYVDFQALVLRSTSDLKYLGNDQLARFLIEQKGVDASRLEKEPALMHGFDLKLDESGKGYGLLVVPNADFQVHHDDRLLEKWHRYRFDNVDSMGLPIQLDKRNGSRTWSTRKEGLSWLVLDSRLDLDSDWGNLDYSDLSGRVIVLSDH